MPLEHFAVWLSRERITGKPTRESAAVDRVGDVEALHCGLEERDMFFGLEQELDGLPSYKALGSEGWNCGRGKRVGLGL